MIFPVVVVRHYVFKLSSSLQGVGTLDGHSVPQPVLEDGRGEELGNGRMGGGYFQDVAGVGWTEGSREKSLGIRKSRGRHGGDAAVVTGQTH